MSNQTGDINARDHAIVHVGNNITNNYHNKSNEKTEQDDIDECLANLRRQTDPRLDKARIERKKGGLLVDSYQWVLHSPEFQQWRDDEECRLLWIKGNPGKGKTMLMCGIINELEPITKLKNPDSQVLMAYFLCEATNTKTSNAASVLRGLVYLLAVQNPSLTSYLLEHQHGKSQQDIDHWNSFESISQILSMMLGDPVLQDAYLIIDALDECTSELEFLLDFITLNSSSSVKWIVSGRNHRNIEELLSIANQKVPLSLELNQDSVSSAVDIFIKDRVMKLTQRKKCTYDTELFIQNYLNTHSGGTFLWVALVCSELDKSPEWNLKEDVQRFPAGLGPLYKLMMNQVNACKTANLCQKVLTIVMTVYRPITIQELASLEEAISDPEDVPGIVIECGSFLTVKDDTIYFVHQSAKEFLVQEMGEKHHSVFQRCLVAMDVLKKDVYSLNHPAVTVKDACSQQPTPDPLAGAYYSCAYWVDHLIDAEKDAKKKGNTELGRQVIQQDELKRFISTRILFWVEALSINQALSNGMSSMLRLIQFFESQSTSDGVLELLSLVHDLHKFIQYFRPCIEEYPLQIYALGLVFSPKESLVRSKFLQHAPTWLDMKPEMEMTPGTEEHQDACLQILETGYDLGLQLSFAPESQRIAAWSLSEYDIGGRIKIWDAADGAPQPMKQEFSNVSKLVVMSPDWQWLASVSRHDDSELLQVWNYNKGTVEWSKSVFADISRLVFSPDGQWLAIVSGDGTGRNYVNQLWEMRTNTMRTLEEGDDQMSIRFSPDSQLIAIFSWNSLKYVLDVRTGQYQHPHERLAGKQIDAAAFLPNSQKLALASNDHKEELAEIWLQDFTSEVCEKVCSISSCTPPGVERMEFSPDGHVLAVAMGETVQLYDASAFTLLQQIPVRFSWGCPLAISSNNQRLAVGCDDGIVRLWDLPPILAYPRSQSQHVATEPISELSLSANRKLLAARHIDGRIQVWNTDTGCLTSTFQLGRYATFSWALGGDLLASASEDKVSIWDPISGKKINSWHLKRVYSNFSIGGRPRVAISSGHPNRPSNFSAQLMRLRETVKDQLKYKRIEFTIIPAEISPHSSHSESNQPISDDKQPQRQWIATTDRRVVLLWDALRPSPKRVLDPSYHFNYVGGIAFCPTGRFLAILGHAGGHRASQRCILLLYDIVANSWRRIDNPNVPIFITSEVAAGGNTHVSFSPSGRLVIVATTGEYVFIWDVETRASSVYALETNASHTIAQNDSNIITDQGILNLAGARSFEELQTEKQTLDYSGCGIAASKTWITWNGYPILWLPVEYRPEHHWVCQISIHEIFIACRSGRILRIAFSPEALQSMGRKDT